MRSGAIDKTFSEKLNNSRLGFGAMRLCGAGALGYPTDPGVARTVLWRALELGVTLIDTADAYGPFINEEQIADSLHPYPADVTVATKGGYTRSNDGQWVPDGRPEYLIAACEASLKRLRVETIALYQWHHPDVNVPFEESIGALKKLREDGKVRNIGLSNVSARQVAAAMAITPIVSVQNHYSVGARTDSNEEVIAVCEQNGLAFIAYFPIHGGFFARAGGMMARVADRHGATTAQIALAWLLQRSRAIVPIPGTSSAAHLQENVASQQIVLSQREFEALNRLRHP